MYSYKTDILPIIILNFGLGNKEVITFEEVVTTTHKATCLVCDIPESVAILYLSNLN